MTSAACRCALFAVYILHLFDLTLSQIVFSNTKGIAAICVGMCVDRGLLQALAPPPPHPPHSLLNRKRAGASDTGGSCTTL
jgi:hypothetical protein